MSDLTCWSKDSQGRRLLRTSSFVLSMIFMLSSCQTNNDPTRLNSNERGLLIPLIEKNKIIVDKSGHINNIEWDSLSTQELEIALKTGPIRKMVEDLFKETGLNPESKVVQRYSSPTLKRLVEAYRNTEK